MNVQPVQQFPGVATVLGYQDDGNGGGFWLYNLTVPIPGHPVGSTVSADTLADIHADLTGIPSP